MADKDTLWEARLWRSLCAWATQLDLIGPRPAGTSYNEHAHAALLQHLQSCAPAPRSCLCGQAETAAAWAAGGKGCPRCGAPWPEHLLRRKW